MAQRDRSRLETVLADVQARWGTQALRSLGKTHPARVSPVPTGFSALDRALGIGGLPRGHITEVRGLKTSGMGTLALKVIGQAHAAGELAAYLDMGNTFDADYAVRCGVQPDNLLLVRPGSAAEALDIAHTLVRAGGTSVLVCDFAHEQMRTEKVDGLLRKLVSPLAPSGCAFLCLFASNTEPTASDQAGIRLLMERQRWLIRRQDVQGYRAQVTILKNKFASVHRPVSIVVGFSGTVQGDGV